MEYTVEFYKSNVNDGRTIIHETTLCETDETKLKREVTKIAKTLEPFAQLQKECPVSWDTYGYDHSGSYGKRWTPYTPNFPFGEKWGDNNYTYSISVSRTSSKFKTAEKKVYDAGYNLKKGHEALTNNNHAFNPDISKIDPEIAEIIGVDLPKHYEALIDLTNAVEKRLKAKVDEFNSRE
ncbi:hypothetical protein F4Z99_04150 [Candidatus Poribacteria bacterium]|nr:hypothetical protein [Candidatus Poribacteria bacterium]MYB02487.1 hypothetical protein [Candidatus Poribacteria bacterium]